MALVSSVELDDEVGGAFSVRGGDAADGDLGKEDFGSINNPFTYLIEHGTIGNGKRLLGAGVLPKNDSGIGRSTGRGNGVEMSIPPWAF